MMKKKRLEMKLQELKSYSSKAELEQYNTPADIAADVLCLAYSLGDIQGKKVVELGCGNGIFAIGAKLLGAKKVVGVDLDSNALDVAEENIKRIGIEVEFINSNVSDFFERCDTVVQNPPFGAQKAHKHADMLFIRKAFEIAHVVYSLHLLKTREFVTKNIGLCKAKVALTKSYKLPIAHTYPFHKKEIKSFDVIMVRGVKDGES